MADGNWDYTIFICFLVLIDCHQGQAVKDSNCDPLLGRVYDVSGTGISVINMTLPATLSPKNVLCLNVSHNNISTLVNVPFGTLWNLKSLDLSHNKITEVPSSVINLLPKLELLYATHNRLTSLADNLFARTYQLQMVNFSNNQISDVPLSVFNHSLTRLSVVDLSHNSLTSYEPWSYVEGTITSLDLRWNNISQFSNDNNFVMPKASMGNIYDSVTTDMRHNSLRRWSDEYILQYFNHSEVSMENALGSMIVDLRDNPWICDCHMYTLASRMFNTFYKWSKHIFLMIRCHDPPQFQGKRILYDMDLSDFACNITQNCPDKCLCQDRPNEKVLNVDCRGKGLTRVPETVPLSPYGDITLQLDDNRITSLANVSYSKQIVQLSITNNSLTQIEGSVIEDLALRENSKVDFRMNFLTSLPETLHNIKYQHVHIRGNRLECSCDMLWMVDWIKTAPKNSDKTVTCTYKEDIYKVIELDESILECVNTGSIILIVILSVVMAVVVALLVTAKRCPYETKVLLHKIFRIHPLDKYIVDTQDKDYDMYVSFDEEDPYVRQWVKKVLVRQLELKKPFYRLGFSCRNMKAGSEAEARLDLLEESKRVLIVLSSGCDRNRWFQYEATQSECMEDIDGRIIYLLYGKDAIDLADNEPWKSRISGRKCFTVGSRMLWSKLRYELPVKPSQGLSRF